MQKTLGEKNKTIGQQDKTDAASVRFLFGKPNSSQGSCWPLEEYPEDANRHKLPGTGGYLLSEIQESAKKRWQTGWGSKGGQATGSTKATSHLIKMNCPFGFKECQKEDCEMWDGKECKADDLNSPDHERDIKEN